MLSCIPLTGWTLVYVSVHLLKHIWAASRSWQLSEKLPQTSAGRFFVSNMEHRGPTCLAPKADTPRSRDTSETAVRVRQRPQEASAVGGSPGTCPGCRESGRHGGMGCSVGDGTCGWEHRPRCCFLLVWEPQGHLTGMTGVGAHGLPPDHRPCDRPVPVLLGWPTFRNPLGPGQTGSRSPQA